MAVLGKIEVTVSSGGRVLPEYTVDPDVVEKHEAAKNGNAPMIVKYIESTPGEEFAIHYKLLEGQDFGTADYIGLRSYFDGTNLAGSVFDHCRYVLKGSLSATRYGAQYDVNDHTSMLKCFLWKELQTTEEAPLQGTEDFKKYAQLGTIRVVAERNKTVPSQDEGLEKISLNEGPVPEKALKGQAVGSTIGLGPERPAERIRVRKGVQADQYPLAIFVFLYRTKRDLQKLGVIPRTPSPVPLEQRDVNTLSNEELRELVTRQQAELILSRQDTESKIKKDPDFKVRKEAASDNTNSMVTRGLKREATDRDEDDDNDIVVVRSEKKPCIEPEVIDLSD
ncbi:hypothetical protein H2204_000907 [Knufia peltigerae]|uniref:DUF7918 domain-containing protein n=1 Tax=Knufia peltigerae TaxID=1002370 RepID=A0AA39D4M6_9EURO|nr:hypothetical protein H2204_000907 [Knufia peltigerae]